MWPANREEAARQAAEAEKHQRLTLTCGVDGCRRKWAGPLDKVRAKRDEHRAEKHPGFVPPARRTVQGFGEKRRVR